jgi:predicted DNA-binding protein (MmcQ/YjbR family)
MNIELIREYCLKKKGVTEEFPFDEETLVFKVMAKIFLLASLESIPLQINLKCDPEKAVELREEYDAVQPGYHMNKKHWNTIIIDGSISSGKISEWIDESYSLVAAGLKKSELKSSKNNNLNTK